MADIRKRQGAKGVSWQVRYRGPAGYVYRSFRTAKLARAFVQSIGERVDSADDAPSLTVGQAIDLWLETVETVGRHGREPVGPATLRKYRERADNHLRPLLGDVPIGELDAPRAVRFRDDLLRRCARPTAKKCLTDLKGALAEARVRGHLATDPLADIRIVDSGRRRRRPVIPTRAEMAAIEAAFRRRRDHQDGRIATAWERYYPLMMVLRWTAARPEEARALTDGDVLADRGRIRIRQAADESGVIGPVKTAQGYRAIEAPAAVFDAVADWQMIRAAGPRPDALLFPTRGGNPEGLANITNRAWYPTLRDAALAGRFDLYSLRHYRISERLAAGDDPQLVAEQAGHADAGFTLRTYGHVLREGLR